MHMGGALWCRGADCRIVIRTELQTVHEQKYSNKTMQEENPPHIRTKPSLQAIALGDEGGSTRISFLG